jgi:hypothetical protein
VGKVKGASIILSIGELLGLVECLTESNETMEPLATIRRWRIRERLREWRKRSDRMWKRGII